MEAFQENDNDTNHKDDEHATEDENMVNTVVTYEIPVQRNNEERTSNDEVKKDDDEPRQISQEVSAAAPGLIPVHCIATVENCPDSILNEDYGDSIRRFITSEPHLAQNIVSADLQHVSSRSFRHNIFTHTVSIVMYVKTVRLWENPASYIRKHLGMNNYWTRSNGAVVKLSRIHQK